MATSSQRICWRITALPRRKRCTSAPSAAKGSTSSRSDSVPSPFQVPANGPPAPAGTRVPLKKSKTRSPGPTSHAATETPTQSAVAAAKKRRQPRLVNESSGNQRMNSTQATTLSRASATAANDACAAGLGIGWAAP